MNNKVIINICDKYIYINKFDNLGVPVDSSIIKNEAFLNNEVYNLNKALQIVKQISKKIDEKDYLILSISSSNIECKKYEKTLSLNDTTVTKDLIKKNILTSQQKSKTIQTIPFKFEIDGLVVFNPVGLKGEEFVIHYNEYSISWETFNNLKKVFEEFNIYINEYVLDIQLQVNSINDKKPYNLISFFDNYTILTTIKDSTIISFDRIDLGYNIILNDLKQVLNLKENISIDNLIKNIGINYNTNLNPVVNINENGTEQEIEIDTISKIIYYRLEEIFVDIINNDYKKILDNNKTYVLGEKLQNCKGIQKTLELFGNFELLSFLNHQGVYLSLNSNFEKDFEEKIPTVSKKIEEKKDTDILLETLKPKEESKLMKFINRFF